MAKVLLIAPTCNGDDVGEAWVAFQWARWLASRHDLTVLTYHKQGARPASAQLSGARIVEWTEPPFLGRFERLNSMMKPGYVPFYVRARRWIRSALAAGERFDVAHQPAPVAMRYPSPATGLGIPLVIGPVGGGLSSPPGFAADEGSAPWYMKLREIDGFRRRFDPLLRRTYREADCVLGIADYVREQLADIPLRRFEVMIDIGLDEAEPPIDRADRTGPVRLLYVGRLVRTKGVRDVVAAMAKLRDLPVRLDIVGEGPERGICEALVGQLSLSDRVVLHGWRSKDEVASFYRGADVFVFPSYREPGGSVVLEAMGHSLPLIVVDRGGPGSTTSSACAIRLDATTPAALVDDIAAAIRLLVNDESRRLAMGAAARAHAEQTGLWRAKLDRIDAIYDDILRKKAEERRSTLPQSDLNAPALP